MSGSKLVEAYAYAFGNAKKSLTEEDIGEIMLGCGILDATITHNMYAMLQRNTMAYKAKKDSIDIDTIDPPEKIPPRIFDEMCATVSVGQEAAKINFIFDFID